MRTQLPLPQKGQRLQFLDHDYCGQMAAWVKMPLCMEVGLSPGHIMLDGTQLSLPKKGASPSPNFRPMFVLAKRLDGSRCHLVQW